MLDTRKTFLMKPSSNCTVPDPRTLSCEYSPTAIWKTLQSDGDGSKLLEWVIWWDALDSNTQLSKNACKVQANKACPLPDEEGLDIEILCCSITSFNASSFL